MDHPVSSTLHCINPKCSQPDGQPWGNKYCQRCGAPLELNNRYVPLRCLGTGGFSTLYVVWDLKTQTEKVLKVLLEPSPKALELFEQEASVLARMRHPGVPKVSPDSYFLLKKRNSTLSPLPCLVMEKIHGLTLQEILDEHPHGCPEEWVIDWLQQALEILRELHGANIIHRDLKPSNLMLRSTPAFPLTVTPIQTHQLVMIDFGGAKQVGRLMSSDREATPRSTTRLVSPGYSPPEQIVGATVGPPADFYALGRTCIHLLTGVYPADLEDPITAELRWQHRAVVSPWFANLLDQMVQDQAIRRPQTATEIQTYLFKIARQKRYPRRMMSLSQWGLDVVKTALLESDRALWNLIKATGSLSAQLMQVSMATLWGMGLAGVGGIAGAVFGLVLAYWTPVGQVVAEALSSNFPLFFPGAAMRLGTQILVLGLAGLGTGLGLTDAGGYDMNRRYKRAAMMGSLGYIVGGISWQILSLFGTLGHLCMGLSAAVLTLGLGLPSHRWVSAMVVAAGTTGIFWGLSLDQTFPPEVLQFPSVGIQPQWEEFWFGLGFIGLLGCATGLSLAVSHYLIVPILRWLGWR
ncbi:kinase domain protein [Lyngbya aestuarii BL J]|uniref:non-specific serine/threonine protein kinase n=1 Tax=Lyngbya aestuarii BL J TaxID=1348334 RepID=U7QME0_9CYAN|nr:serine/threonine-protein kinase [Lyngbya aestuarii]ERT09048.1 kinase domain protein [Lyngbya aestuarii BL J]